MNNRPREIVVVGDFFSPPELLKDVADTTLGLNFAQDAIVYTLSESMAMRRQDYLQAAWGRNILTIGHGAMAIPQLVHLESVTMIDPPMHKLSLGRLILEAAQGANVFKPNDSATSTLERMRVYIQNMRPVMDEYSSSRWLTRRFKNFTIEEHLSSGLILSPNISSFITEEDMYSDNACRLKQLGVLTAHHLDSKNDFLANPEAAMMDMRNTMRKNSDAPAEHWLVA